jgi:hypothetical protein
MTARFDKLIEIVKLYQREANRCHMAKAHVSGCIALGAVLEAQLLALCILYRHHLRLSPTFVGKIKTGRVLWKVSLHDLIEVARELDWLPRTAKYKGKSIADWAHLVREIRDLAHAGRWVRKYKKEKISAAHFRMSYEILQTVSEHLEHVIYMTWKRRGLI